MKTITFIQQKLSMLMLFDYAYGISSALGDRKQFDGNQCLVDALYSDASNVNEESDRQRKLFSR